MSGGMPYVGSKISLISKAEIRYEGILFTIDAKESTVALAKVRSFGTEDRPTDRPVAPQDTVYEFIIFRGSDIKDLHVCEPPKPSAPPPQTTLPQDPAIIKSSQAATTTSSVTQPQGPSFTTPAYQPFGYQAYNQFVSGPVAPTQPTAQPFNAAPAPPVGASGSRGASPPGLSRRSPSIDAGVQVNARPAPAKSGSRGSTSPVQRKTPVDQGTQVTNHHHSHHQDGSRREDRPQRGSGSGQEHQGREPRMYAQAVSGGRQQPQQQQHQHHHNQDHRQQRGEQHAADGHRGQNRARSGQDHRGPGSGGGSSGYRNHRGSPRGGGARGSGGRGGANRPRQEPLKFEGDFDFESSNAKFDKENIEKELKTKLVINTEKVANGSEKDGEEVETETTSTNTTTNTTEAEPAEDKDDVVYYDKTKSFFDNISCEATEREKGINNRPNWREERRMNSETFGISSTSAYRRGGYNRRGGFRGRGGSGGGGGFRGGRGRMGNNSGGRGGSRGRRNQGWVDYDYNYEAAGIHRKNQENKNVRTEKQ